MWKIIIFSVITVTIFFFTLETVARLIVPSPSVATYQEHEKIITVLGLPSLNETMEFDFDLFWRLKKNLRNFLVKGRIRNHKLSFTVNTYDGFRSSPVSPNKDKLRIMAIGDSCTFGLGVNDNKTWPAQFEALLRREGFSAEVINAGIPGYTAFQGKRLLEKKGLNMKPDIVIACFGFNDSDIWASHSDIETARKLALKYWESLLVHSRLYYGLKLLLSHLVPYENYKNARVTSRIKHNKKTSTTNRPRLSAKEFYKALKDIKKLCVERDITLILLIWPFEGQVTKKISQLLDYQNIVAFVCRNERIPCVNLVEAFIKTEKSLYIDHIHANEEGCLEVANAVFRAVKPMLHKRHLSQSFQ